MFVICSVIIRIQFSQKLFHQVFIRANGIRIITEQITNNQELLVWSPTTQKELASPLVDELIQPCKTSTIRKTAHFTRKGETSGGSSISPDRDRCCRDGQRFANKLTHDVRPQNLKICSAVTVLSAVLEEPLSGHNLDLSTEAYD